MPTDFEKYFSFGQFAIELNELEEGLRDQLPQTDCRFRPDQRYVRLLWCCVTVKCMLLTYLTVLCVPLGFLRKALCRRQKWRNTELNKYVRQRPCCFM